MSTRKINQSEKFFSRLLMLQGEMTSSQFCRFIGVSTPLYQKWKKGSVPGYDKLKLIAIKFGKSPDWLLGISTDPPAASDPPTLIESKPTCCAPSECQECKKKQAHIDRLERIIDKLTTS